MPGTTAVRKCMWALFSGQLWIQRVTHNSTVAVITPVGDQDRKQVLWVGRKGPHRGHSLFEGMET